MQKKNSIQGLCYWVYQNWVLNEVTNRIEVLETKLNFELIEISWTEYFKDYFKI